MAEQFANLAESTLAGSIGAGDTTINVADGSSFPATGDFRVVVDDEIMLCTARTGNQLTVSRGAESTGAVGHLSGAVIAHVLTAASILLIPLSHAGLSSVTADQHHAQSHTHNADGSGSVAHSSLTGVTADQHHAEAHTLASHSTRPHSDLTGVTSDQHHAQAHAIGGADHTGTLAHTSLGSVTADQHHAEVHAIIGAAHSGTIAHTDLSGVTANQHHNQAHTVSDHTSAVTVQDEGVAQGDVHTLNIVGTGISATVAAGVATIDATAASGTGYSEVQEEGSALTARGKLNFLGDTVLAADDSGAGRTNVTVDSYGLDAAVQPVGTVSDAGDDATIARTDHIHAHEAAHIAHDTAWNAKGDIIAGTGVDTAGILTLGTSGQVLAANVSEATGLEWVSQGIIRDEFEIEGSDTSTDTGTQNDWSFATDICVIRWDGDAVNDITVTGIQCGQAHGQVMIVENTADVSGVDMTLNNEDTGSTAANRFRLPGNTNMTVLRGEAVFLLYDSNVSRWRAVAKSSTGVTDHGALTGLADDDHPQYATDTDLTTHAGAADPHTGYLKESDFDDIDFLVGTATGHTAAEIVVGTTPGGELGGTWASPTVDATHSGSTHASATAAAWPVGSVFIAVVSTNPATLLGFGTWSAFATGRMLIGIDSGQAEYDTVEETGGSETHNHNTHSSGGSHTHNDHTKLSNTDNTGGADRVVNPVTHSSDGGHTHDAHSTENHVPPYIVVYMWKRTA